MGLFKRTRIGWTCEPPPPRSIKHSPPSDIMQETPQIRVVPNSSADDDIVIVEDGPSTSDIAKTFLQDIENLGDNILKLDQDFRQIHTALGAVDSSSSADGGRSNLQADWKKFMNVRDLYSSQINTLTSASMGYGQTYSTLLRESRTTATKAEAYLEGHLTEPLTETIINMLYGRFHPGGFAGG